MKLSDAELERYARQIVLPQVGGVGQGKLKQAAIAPAGLAARSFRRSRGRASAD